MVQLPEPVRVSPVIKFFRYSFLLAGIFYGITKRRIYKVFADKEREQYEATADERARRLEEERLASAERDLQAIIEIFRPKPKRADVKYSAAKDRSSSSLIGNMADVNADEKIQVADQSAAEAKNENEANRSSFEDEDIDTCLPAYDGKNVKNEVASVETEEDTTTANLEICGIYTRPINLKEKTKNEKDSANTQKKDENDGYYIEKHPEDLMKPEENKDFQRPKTIDK